MKTNRKLLELAARAAGVDWFDEPAVKQGRWLHLKSGQFWNPLRDDGDALRLAVKLRLTVCTDGDTTVSASETWHSDGVFVTQTVSECVDKLAATRRAIVRAAAAIGEGMK